MFQDSAAFGSEISALVTISNRVWSSERGKEYFGGVLYYSFSMCRSLCDLDLSFAYP